MLLSSDEEDIEQMYQLKITIMIVSFIHFFFFFGVLKNLALFFEFQYPCPSLPSVARDDRKQLRCLNMI